MNTINLKTTEKKLVDLELSIPVPSFYRSKDEKEWLAVFDEQTVISISTVGSSFWVSKQGLSTKEDEVSKAFQTYHSCTETEFIQKYDEVIQSISKNTLLEV